jgi:hypothetical protein
MKRILSLKFFVVVSLLLFLATSYENTRLLAGNFHGTNPLLPWAYAGAVELGVIGLSVGIIVRRRNNQPARGYATILMGVLALSVTANFLMGAQSFYPEFQIMSRMREWSFWWLLPLAFSAAVPVLIFAFSELLATLVLEEEETTRSTAIPRPLVVQGASGRERSEVSQLNESDLDAMGVSSNAHPEMLPSDESNSAMSRVPQREPRPLLPEDESNLVVRVVALYGQQPETPLSQLARELGVSASTASRLRIQAMQQGLLVRVSRSCYSANGHRRKAA